MKSLAYKGDFMSGVRKSKTFYREIVHEENNHPVMCENSGHSVEDDFPEVRKIVDAGITSKPVKDYELTRYACYLIVQNGDPRKEVIALGQTYFAIQTYRQKVADHFNELDVDDIHKRKNLEVGQKILDYMGSTELIANLFRISQTEEKSYKIIISKWG